MRVTFSFSSSEGVSFCSETRCKPVPMIRVFDGSQIFLQGIGKESTLNLRIPVWTNSEGAKVSLNGQSLKVPASGDF